MKPGSDSRGGVREAAAEDTEAEDREEDTEGAGEEGTSRYRTAGITPPFSRNIYIPFPGEFFGTGIEREPAQAWSK